jgi:hypothetical protein
VGELKIPEEHRQKSEAKEVNEYDFLSLGIGMATPYEIYLIVIPCSSAAVGCAGATFDYPYFNKINFMLS